MSARILDLPKDGDKQKCLACGSPHLDTGWECTDCGYDNQPWYDRAALAADKESGKSVAAADRYGPFDMVAGQTDPNEDVP